MEQAVETMKRDVRDHARRSREEIWQIARQIGEHPELGYQEYFAVEVLSDYLRRNGFSVETGIAGLETAFVARYPRSAPLISAAETGAGTKIAFLAEYDALPEIGHGCGHHLIAAASAGAAAVLSKIASLPGEVWVVGTPAEETSGAKVLLAEQGFFAPLDAVMMVHPGSQNISEISTLALDALEFTFIGKAAHPSAAARHGVNALDALIHFFTEIKAWQQTLPNIHIQGVITEGGVTPNIVPARATARFYLRASKRTILDSLLAQVICLARESAAYYSAELEWRKYEHSYDEMISNRSLAACFAANLQASGVKKIVRAQHTMGSVDLGNVSRVAPVIHPYLALGDGSAPPHTRAFTQAALSKNGEQLLHKAVVALAWTAWDVLTDETLRVRIREEFLAGMESENVE